MPVIMYKETTIQAICFQARRIMCEHCSEHFLYHHSQEVTGQTTGVPLLSSDVSMAKKAMQIIVKQVIVIGRTENPGDALCPHCKQYQGWMIKNMNRSATIWGGALGFAAGVAMGFWLVTEFHTMHWALAFLPSIILTLVGANIFKRLWTKDKGPHTDLEDPRAMTDEEFGKLIADCRELDEELKQERAAANQPEEGEESKTPNEKEEEESPIDPVLMWSNLLGISVADNVIVITLGVTDQTGAVDFGKYGSAHLLDELLQA